MVVFNNWSKQQDQESNGEGLKQRMKALAAPGVILYILAMTFAAIDWVMSLVAAVGFDDLRIFVCGRAGDCRDGVDDRGDCAAGRARNRSRKSLRNATCTTWRNCSSRSTCCGPTLRFRSC